MTTVEFQGGEINHRYLMRKTKDWLWHTYCDNARRLGTPTMSRFDWDAHYKDTLATIVMRQFRTIWARSLT